MTYNMAYEPYMSGGGGYCYVPGTDLVYVYSYTFGTNRTSKCYPIPALYYADKIR